MSNPDPQAFEDYAGERIARHLSEDLCGRGGLPLLFQLIAQDCERLVQDQRSALGRLARSHTRRVNLGLFSLYATELGGQALLPGLRLPRFSVTTLAVAGRFHTLPRLDQDDDASDGQAGTGSESSSGQARNR
ncbi:DUF4359 domain-containing protein [Synechococcus sp. RSCCF101]|nr:DUF4359 domain-containing protein [Synechococcus sp. RSCCF101]QEY33576.1 DUF4359 domain-containing protein [Synechococcus sp. RSCCF101]